MNCKYPFRNQRFQEEEIFFVSDIEHFTEADKDFLLNQISQKKYKLLVFLGDILRFYNSDDEQWRILDSATLVVELCGAIVKWPKKKQDTVIDPIACYELIGKNIDKRIKSFANESLKTFFSFIDICAKRKVYVLYYVGNHDYVLSYDYGANSYVPSMRKIREKFHNMYFPKHLEMLRMNNNLYLLGIEPEVRKYVGTPDVTMKSNEAPSLEMFVNSLNEIPNAESTILVSHIPGIMKYKKLGSKEISLLKKKFKFKVHYHGHCKDYYGLYYEHGVPTVSVHIDNAHKKMDNAQDASHPTLDKF